MAHFCAVLDYPDEDIDPFREEQMRQTLLEQETALSRLLASGRRGYELTHGIPCAIHQVTSGIGYVTCCVFEVFFGAVRCDMERKKRKHRKNQK